MQITTLLIRCQAGDADAIQDLIGEYQSVVFRLALSILDDSAEADEAAQDTFLAALRALESYRGDASFQTWLYRITVNICRDRLRKRQARERVLLALQSVFHWMGAGPAHPEETVIQRETSAALWQAVNQLNEKHRLPVILFYYHDLSVAEIAGVLDLSAGTVLSRLFTARERLQSMLADPSGADSRPLPKRGT